MAAKAAAALTTPIDSCMADQELGQQIRNDFDEQRPDAVVVFASARNTESTASAHAG